MTPADVAWIVFGAIWLIGAFLNKRTARRQSMAWLAGHCPILVAAGTLLLKPALRDSGLAWRFVPDSATRRSSGV